MKENSKIKVYGLGAFKIELGTEKIEPEEWKSKKALKLFKYLLINYGKPSSVDKIVDKLWPDCSNLNTGRQRLYDTVYQLRQEIDQKKNEKSYVQNGPQGYRLDFGSDYWFDWKELEEIYKLYKDKKVEELIPEEVEAGIERLKSAVDLYKGEFMGQDLYEDWVEIPRARYRQILLDLIMITSKWLSQVGRNEEALDYLEYGINEEPFREDFYLLSMKVLNKENKVWEQAILYKKYTEILENELGIPPSKAVQNEYHKLKEANLIMFETEDEQIGIDLENELEELKEDSDLSGALECDFNTFKDIYKLKRRKAARTGQPSTLLRISFDQIFSSEELDEQIEKMKQKLRGIDVISRCNSSIIVLLPGAPLEANLIIGQRILGAISLRELGANPQINWEEISESKEDKGQICRNLMTKEKNN